MDVSKKPKAFHLLCQAPSEPCCSGSILDPNWVQFGIRGSLVRPHFGSISDPFRCCISGPTWVHLGSILLTVVGLAQVASDERKQPDSNKNLVFSFRHGSSVQEWFRLLKHQCDANASNTVRACKLRVCDSDWCHTYLCRAALTHANWNGAQVGDTAYPKLEAPTSLTTACG